MGLAHRKVLRVACYDEIVDLEDRSVVSGCQLWELLGYWIRRQGRVAPGKVSKGGREETLHMGELVKGELDPGLSRLPWCWNRGGFSALFHSSRPRPQFAPFSLGKRGSWPRSHPCPWVTWGLLLAFSPVLPMYLSSLLSSIRLYVCPDDSACFPLYFLHEKWRRKWQPTSVFLLDRGVWWARAHRVTRSRKWLSD